MLTSVRQNIQEQRAFDKMFKNSISHTPLEVVNMSRLVRRQLPSQVSKLSHPWLFILGAATIGLDDRGALH